MEQLIKSTNLKNAHLMDFFEVMSIVATFLEKENLETLKLTTVVAEFTKSLELLEKALTQARKTGITESLLEADNLRDNIFTGFTNVLRGMTYFSDVIISEAAVAITDVVKKYGKGVKRLPQREETAVLTNLIEDLKNDEYKEQVAVAGLTIWVEKLEQANVEFENLYTQRTEKEAQFVVGLAQMERENMQNAFVKLCRTIEAYAIIEGEEKYKPLGDKINAEVSNVQQAIKARKKNKKTDVEQ